MAVGKELFGEGKHVEFKVEIPKRHEKFLKDIIAFSNTSGGKIILGIEDETGVVVGIGEQNPFRLSDTVSNMIADACTPQIYTDITPRTLEGKTVLEVQVYPGRQRPYYLKAVGKEKSAYIRVNGTSRVASERKLKELEMEGLKISYDTLPEIGKAYNKEESLALCEKMYQTALAACKTQEERDDIKPITIEKLEDFGILRKAGRELQPTRAFTLLTKPRDRFVKIQCALFKGTVRDEFIDRKEFDGPIQDQIEMAYQFVLRHINRGAVIEGLYRQDIYELPIRSVREMIINAVLHRSYLDESSVQVSLYDDRLEIDSPGMLYDGLTVTEALSGKSRCRNTAIAEAFQYMKMIEAWGTGLPRLYRSCREMGLPEPSFSEFGDGMKVIIYRAAQETIQTNIEPAHTDTKTNTENTYTDTETNTENTYSDTETNTENSCTNTETDTERKILSLINENPSITIKEMADKTGLSVSGVRYILTKLRKKNIIQREGAQKNGKWEIIDQ